MKTKITLLFYFCCLYSGIAQISVTEGAVITNNPDMIGCNNNTTLIEEPWDDPNRLASLKNSRISNLRYPGGTVSENWDFRNDTFFPAKGTPGSEDGWVDPDKMIGFAKSIIVNGSGKTNSIENLAKAQQATGVKPVFVMNMTTPGLDYYAEKFGVAESSSTFQPLGVDWQRAMEDRVQRNLEMLRRASANGLPVKYVELSNEVYFGAGEYQYKNFQGFREGSAGVGYPEACHLFITEIKKEFPDAKFSAVAFFNTDGSSGKRKHFWNDYVIPKLDRNLVDALTMHCYIESNPNQTASNQNELNAMLNSFGNVFEQAKVDTDYDNLVTADNWDIWWTEYMPNFFKIGSGVNQDRYNWENALVANYNISSYLELASPKLIQMHQFNGLDTNNGGIKAVGRAISLVSLAADGMTSRQPLSFSSNPNLVGTTVPELLGFSFSDANNKNFWITNNSGESKTIDITGLGFSGKILHQSVGVLGSQNDPNEAVSLPESSIVLPPNSITVLMTTDLPKIKLTTTDDNPLENGNTFDFGVVDLNTSKTQEINLFNIGGQTLQINDIRIEGLDAPFFNIENDATGSLGAGDTKTLSITFTASQPGIKNADLVVESTDPDTPITIIKLSGQDQDLVGDFLIKNGGFEADSRDPWIKAGTIEEDESNSRSGVKALKIFIPSSAPEGNRFLGASQSVSVEPSGEYTVQGYYKGTITSDTGAARIKIIALDAGNNSIMETTTNFYRDVEDYRLMTTGFKVPDNAATVEIIPQILAATGTIWFDDIEMAENTNPEPVSILRNGNFDSAQKNPWTNGGNIEIDDIDGNGKESNIMRIFLSNKGFSGARQIVKLNAGSTYNISGKVKRSLTEGFARFFIRYIAEDDNYVKDSEGKDISESTKFGFFAGEDLTYQFIGINNMMPPAEAKFMELNLQLFNGTGSVWWEDIRLEETLAESSLGVSDLESDLENSSFLIYPNPASNFINVSLSNIKNKTIQKIEGVKIYDMGGRVVMNYNNKSNQSANNKLHISVQTLSKGLYILRANFADGNSKAKLFEIK